MVETEILANASKSVKGLSPERNRLSIGWADGARSDFHAIWLRDNCRCEACGAPETGRRKSRLTEIPLDVAIASTQMEENTVVLAWSDGHRSRFSAHWLHAHAYDEEQRRRRGFSPTLWTDEIRRNPPVMDFSAVDQDESAFYEMLTTVRDLGLCLLRDASTESGTLAPFAERIGRSRRVTSAGSKI